MISKSKMVMFLHFFLLLLLISRSKLQLVCKFDIVDNKQEEFIIRKGFDSSGDLLQNNDVLSGEASIFIQSSIPGEVYTYVDGGLDNSGVLFLNNDKYEGLSTISTTYWGDGEKNLTFQIEDYSFTYFVIFSQEQGSSDNTLTITEAIITQTTTVPITQTSDERRGTNIPTEEGTSQISNNSTVNLIDNVITEIPFLFFLGSGGFLISVIISIIFRRNR